MRNSIKSILAGFLLLASTPLIAQKVPTFYTKKGDGKIELGFFAEAYKVNNYNDFLKLDFNDNGKYQDAIDLKTAGYLGNILRKYDDFIRMQVNSKELGQYIKEIFAKSKADGSLPYLENAISQIIDAPSLLTIMCETMGASLSWNTALNVSRQKILADAAKIVVIAKANKEGGIPENYKVWIESNNPAIFRGVNIKTIMAVRPF